MWEKIEWKEYQKCQDNNSSIYSKNIYSKKIMVMIHE